VSLIFAFSSSSRTRQTSGLLQPEAAATSPRVTPLDLRSDLIGVCIVIMIVVLLFVTFIDDHVINIDSDVNNLF